MTRMAPDLPSFIQQLERAKELAHVRVEVDPIMEITEIATRTVKRGGPGLLFERVKGSPHQLAINLLGSARRIEMALGQHPRQIGESLVRVAERLQPPTIQGLWDVRQTLGRTLAMRLSPVTKSPLTLAPDPPSISEFPILQCWPQDGGRYITFGMVLTQDPETGKRNLGVYRMQVLARDRIIVHWQIQKGGGFHYAKAERMGKPLEIAIIIGADPALLISAVAPLPEDMDELAFSGFLRGAPLPIVKGRSTALPIPANAEIVIEGIVPPRERAQEGPFGDHFGHYSHPSPFPVIHVQSVWRRPAPIYLGAVVGKPPQEDRYLGDAVQEILSPLIRLIHPEIKDLWAYYETGFHNLLVVAVDQRHAKEGVKTALGLFGQAQLSLTKCIVVVDPSVPVRDFSAVLTAIRQHFDASKDWLLLPGVPLDTLDFTSFTLNLGSKMILDATSSADAPAQEKPLGPIDPVRCDNRIKAWRLLDDALLVVQVPGSDGRNVLERLVREPSLEPIPLIAAVSPDVPLDDRELLLCGLFTRFDCARDIICREARLRDAWVQIKGPLGIDATFKTGYPDAIVMSPDIVQRVDRRWSEYGIPFPS